MTSALQHTLRNRPLTLVLALCVALLLSAAISAICIGSIPVPPAQVWSVVRYKLLHVGPVPDPLYEMIVWNLRVPRIAYAALVGAALSLAGAVLQGLVRNPLADPFVIGVSSGASLAAVAVMSSGTSLALRSLGVPVAAFIGAIATLVIVLFFAQRGGRFTGGRIVLAGVAVGQVAMAGTTLVQLHSEPAEIRGMLFWIMGSVAGAQFGNLMLPTAAILLSALWLVFQGRNLNALAMGDDDAIALGVNVDRLRLLLIVVVALLTGVSVSMAGGVGFVGLMIPHIARFVIGADYRRLLPVAAISGAAFLVLIDLAARAIDPPNEYPLTIFTAALGGPFFLWLLKQSKTEA
ncbi:MULTISPECIES: FecCD family ABC transporter permease [Nocardiaceae]|uniref:FecCD family ABC transporter permease n=1 Tax=Nocardiaceae TaxID=85025 RepID=UPI000A543388|nr:iron ABC transporter permease [Rhodococcus sp. 06-235-1A]